MHSSSRWCIPSGVFRDENDIASSRDGSKRASAKSVELADDPQSGQTSILEDEAHVPHGRDGVPEAILATLAEQGHATGERERRRRTALREARAAGTPRSPAPPRCGTRYGQHERDRPCSRPP